MKRITFNQVQKWIRLSKKPLEDKELEQFQEDYFGEFRHEYYRFFYHMVAEMMPAVALEIGIDHGHTVAHMAAAEPSTLVIGIDKRVGCARNMPKFPNMRLVYEDSLQAKETMKGLVEKHGPIGIVFQDSSHHYEASKREFEIYSQFLDKNAIWCCDDIVDTFHDPLVDPPGKSMVSYFDELPGGKKRKRIYEDLHYGSKIGIALL